MTVATTDSPRTLTLDEAGQLQNMIELLQENLADVMAADESGWSRVGTDTVPTIDRAQLRLFARLARVMTVSDPLISRGVNLRVAYVWGQGVNIAAAQEVAAEQDVNAVVQAFLDDPSNRPTFTSGQAREKLERRLAADGNAFHALVTSPLSGRVQVRVIPWDEVDDVITNPEDTASPWYYRRTYTTTLIEAGYSGTRSRRETRTVFHPAVGYRPNQRPRSIDGRDVMWDQPVIHTTVNQPDGSKWGVGDAFAALPWARGYKEFLEDWARLVKALSRFAFRATSKARGAAQVRSRLGAAPVAGEHQVGGTVITSEGQSFEAIGKSGATIDSNSGRPLAAMVAAALDVPVTMLLADPGVTGARATAETLDEPLRLIMEMRRDLHGDLLATVLGYVIDQAISAPQGRLKGTQRVDPATGLMLYALANDQSRAVEVSWPSLEKIDTKVLVDAIVAADGTDRLPPLVIAKLLLQALGVDDVDDVLDQVTDGNGDFLPPSATVGDTTATAAAKAFRAGADPAALLN